MTQEISPASRWSPRQVMLGTIFVVLVALGFWLFFRFRVVIFVSFAAILLGTAIKPAVLGLARLGLPRMVAEVLVFLFLVALLVGFFLLAAPLILEQSAVLTTQLSKYYEAFRAAMLHSPSFILNRIGTNMAPSLGSFAQIPKPAAPGSAIPPVTDVSQLIQYATSLLHSLFIAIGIVLMSFYWTLEGDRAIRSILLLAPSARRENLREIIEAVEEKLGGFLLGQAIMCLTIGGLQLIAYLVIGLPNAFVLALMAGVLEAVPTIGPILGALPAVLLAFSTDPSKVIWVLLATVVIQFAENHLLVPRIMERYVRVNPVLTLLAFAAFTSLMGLAGALLAIPVAAIFQLLANRFVLDRDGTDQNKPEGRDYLSLLKYQAQEIAQDIRKQVRNKEEDPTMIPADRIEDALEAIILDLDQVLTQSNPQEGTSP